MADMTVTGVVSASHAGQANYAFQVNGDPQWYVVPSVLPNGHSNAGFAVQALKIEMLKESGGPAKFLADDAQVITFHGGATGLLAHDIDDGQYF